MRGKTTSAQIGELGKKIKDMRVSKRISLRELEKHTGLTRSFLSQVERAVAAPSLASLEKIARGLSIGLSYFFKEAFPKEFSIFKKNRKKKFVFENKNVSCEVLASEILDIAMVPLLFTLNVKGEIKEEQLALYRKERFIFVQKGEVDLTCNRKDEKRFVLDEGDSVYCKCAVSCKRMSNIGNRKAVVLWVIRAPII